jgi:hypothetical protein
VLSGDGDPANLFLDINGNPDSWRSPYSNNPGSKEESKMVPRESFLA